MTLRRLHRLTAIVLAVFIALHLGNHLAITLSPAAHLRVMEALRPLYRPLFVEIPLLLAFALQIGLGVRLALRRPWPRRARSIIQRVSGLILAVFLIQHTIAAIATRLTYDSIDTNIYWAASVVSAPPHVWYFAPYYFLGVFSLFVHLATHLHRSAPRVAMVIAAIGGLLAVAIVVNLMGPHELPAPYIAYRDGYWGLR